MNNRQQVDYGDVSDSCIRDWTAGAGGEIIFLSISEIRENVNELFIYIFPGEMFTVCKN